MKRCVVGKAIDALDQWEREAVCSALDSGAPATVILDVYQEHFPNKPQFQITALKAHRNGVCLCQKKPHKGS